MAFILIRHAATKGNLERRYIGCRTDEGILDFSPRAVPKARRVVTSPLLRCIQTARILYPDIAPEIVSDFRECDFGNFEGRNYLELSGDPAYQAWIDSDGEAPFPNGESKARFSERVVSAFAPFWMDPPKEDIAFVVHGGTIMAIMEKFALPKGRYYDFAVPNGCGYVLQRDGSYRRV